MKSFQHSLQSKEIENEYPKLLAQNNNILKPYRNIFFK